MRFFNYQGSSMKYKSYAALFLYSTMSINTTNATPSQTIQIKNFNLLSSNSDIKLGSGYFSNGLYPLHNQCLQDMPITATNFQSKIALSYSTDLNQLSKNLNVNINAETGWGKYTSDAATDYIKSIQDDDYSINFNYQNTITMDTSLNTNNYYGESALNQSGTAAYKSSTTSFMTRCGDEYIQTLKMGAVLNVTLQIHFESQLQKKNFETTIKGKLGNIFNASSKISAAIEEKGIHGTIDVLAFQTGGQPSNLSQIFGADNNHHITSCNLAQLEQCTKAIDDIIAYAQASGEWVESGFAKQIQIVNGTLVAESLSPVAIADATLGSYERDFGLSVQSDSSTQEILNARKKLNTLYDTMYSNLQFAESVTQSTAFKYLTNTAQHQIKTLIKTTKENLAFFNSGKAINCFIPGTQNLCPKIVETIEQNMSPIDFSPLDLLRGAYYVNIGRFWPFIFINNDGGSMEMYDVNLVPTQQPTHNLAIIPKADYSYIGFRGGYSDYSAGKHIQYEMSYYGQESLIYYNRISNSYSGNPAWRTCINNKCFKNNYAMEVIPF